MRIFSILLVFTAVLFALGCKKENKRTPSGYEYIVHKSTGGAKPKVGDYVYFHAQLRIADSVVNSSRQAAQSPFMKISDPTQAQAAPGQQPNPMEEVLREMAIGDSITLIINIDTIPNKPEEYKDVKEIFYDIVSVSYKSEEQFMKDAEVERKKQDEERIKIQAREAEVVKLVADMVKNYNSGAVASQLKSTPSGLKYIMIAEGNGKKAEAKKLVNVNYYGVLKNGEKFDDSFSRGIPFSFPLGAGQVIKGWDEGIALLKEGGKAFLFVPSALGYGEAGAPPSIPGNAELIFYVELDKVN